MNTHDAVVDAVLAALRRSPAITSGPIEEDTDADLLPEGTREAVIVSLVDSDPLEQYTNRVTWRSRVAINCHVQKDGRTNAGRASRELHARVYARLMEDRTLGGAVVDVAEPRIRQDSAQADTRMGACTGTYPVQHNTSAGSLQA